MFVLISGMVILNRKRSYFSRQQCFIISQFSSFHEYQAIHIVKAPVEGIVGSIPS